MDEAETVARAKRRAERQQRGFMTRKIGLHEDDGSFDREFWSRIDPDRRIEMVWELTLEWYAWQGIDGTQQRLQRSVVSVKRGRG